MARGYGVSSKDGGGCGIAGGCSVKSETGQGQGPGGTKGRAGNEAGARETDGAEKRSLPTAAGDAPKTRWTCGAISAPFFFPSSSSSSSSPPSARCLVAFVSSPILILRELHGVPGTRVGNKLETGEKGTGDDPGGRRLARSFLHDESSSPNGFSIFIFFHLLHFERIP